MLNIDTRIKRLQEQLGGRAQGYVTALFTDGHVEQMSWADCVEPAIDGGITAVFGDDEDENIIGLLNVMIGEGVTE